jgi:hypothetical protein
MPNAVSNRAQLLFVQEAALGGALSSTNLKRMRMLSEAIAPNHTRQHSGQIDPNRNRVGLMDLAKSAGGSIGFELSYTDMVDLLLAAIGAGAGTPDTPAVGTTRYTNGSTLKSFYLEKQFLDNGAIIGIRGAVFNELNLAFTANNPVTGQFGLLAQYDQKEAVTRGTAVVNPATDSVMRSGADVGSLLLDEVAFPAAIQSLNLAIRNNITPESRIGLDYPGAWHLQSFGVSGSMTCYFPDLDLYDKFKAFTSHALSVRVANEAGELTIGLPAFRIMGYPTNIAGQNQDIMAELTFETELGGAGAPYTLSLDVKPAV